MNSIKFSSFYMLFIFFQIYFSILRKSPSTVQHLSNRTRYWNQTRRHPSSNHMCIQQVKNRVHKIALRLDHNSNNNASVQPSTKAALWNDVTGFTFLLLHKIMTSGQQKWPNCPTNHKYKLVVSEYTEDRGSRCCNLSSVCSLSTFERYSCLTKKYNHIDAATWKKI